MAAEELLAELRLGYKDFSLAVDDVVSHLGELEGAVDNGFAQLSDKAKAAFDEFIRQSGQAGTAFSAFGKQVESSTKKMSLESMGSALDAISGKLGKLATTGGDLFGGSLSAAGDFETQLNKINTIAKVGPDQLKAYGENLKTIARELNIGVSPTQAAASAYEVLQGGFEDTASATKVMSAALQLSKAGFADAAQSTQLLGGLLNSYGANADQAGRYTDILFTTVEKGNTSIPDLVGGLGRLSSIAATAGISVEEMAAAIGAATKNGQQTSQAIDGIRGIIGALIKPSKEAGDAMATYGLKVDAASLRQKGLAATLKEIKTAVGDNTTAFKTILPDTEAFATAAALTRDNVASFSEILAANQNALGKTAQAIALTSSGYQAKVDQMKASNETFAISAGQVFLPVASKVVDSATGLADAVGKIPEPIRNAGLLLGGLAVGVGGLGAVIGGGVAALIAINAQFLTVGLNIPKLAGLLKTQALAWGNAAGAVLGYGNAQGLLLRGIAPMLGVFGGLAIAIGGITKAYSDLLVEVTNADLKLKQAERGVSDYFGNWRDGIKEIRTEDAIGLDATALADLGVGTKDIGLKIAEERNRLDTLLTAETIAPGPNASAELAKADADRKRILQNIQDLEQRRRDLEAELQRRAAAPGLREQDQIASKKAAQERYKDELQAIELSKAGHAEKIEQLNALRTRYALDGDERRSLNAKVAQEEERLLQETSSKDKKARDELLKQKRQEIENSTKPEQAKIAALQDLVTKYKLAGDERRTVEDKILAYEQSINRKREADFKKTVDFQLDQSNRRLKEIDLNEQGLELKADRGVNVTGERAENIKARAVERSKQVDIDLAKGIRGVEDPELIRQAQENAKAAKLNIERETQLELEQLRRQGVEQEVSRRGAILDAEEALKARRIELLKEQLQAGTASEQQLRQEILDRLQLQEQEIRLQEALAKQQTEDPARIAQIEAEAQGKIFDARRAARGEIEATIQALGELKKKQQEQKNGFTLGNVRGIESLNDFSAFDVNPSGKSKSGLENLRELDTRLLEDSILGNGRMGSRTLYELQQRNSAPIPPQGPPKMTLELVLKDASGKAINFEFGKNDLNGKNSIFNQLTRGMGQ